MPIFTFLCNDCGFEFDEIVGRAPSYSTPHECPHCSTNTAFRLPSAPSSPRGSFGTTHRNTSLQKVQKFNFKPGKS